MAAKRAAVKAVDWVKLGSMVPKSATSEFVAFRTRHETIKGSLSLMPEKPEPINWDFYKSNIKNAALVEKFHAAYSKVTVPVPEDTESANIAAEEKEIDAEIIQIIKNKKETISNLRNEIAKMKSLKPFEDMTTEEFLAANPEVKKEVDNELLEVGLR